MAKEYIERTPIMLEIAGVKSHLQGDSDWISGYRDALQAVGELVQTSPAVDVAEVVRCKDCRNGRPIDKTRYPEKYFLDDCVVCECESVVGDEPMIYRPTHFCSYGERRTDDGNKENL